MILENIGWVCPRCKKVWNPSIKSCDCEPMEIRINHIPNPSTSGGYIKNEPHQEYTASSGTKNIKFPSEVSK